MRCFASAQRPLSFSTHRVRPAVQLWIEYQEVKTTSREPGKLISHLLLQRSEQFIQCFYDSSHQRYSDSCFSNGPEEVSRWKRATFFFFATLSPTWEFQPCLKSCNLASWTTKWHDSSRGTSRPPAPPQLKIQLLRNTGGWNLVGVLRVCGGCLEGI